MYSKLILIQHEYENENIIAKIKYTIYKLFATINELREFSNLFVKSVILFGILQIASIFKSQKEDDFSNYIPIVSTILNYIDYINTLDPSTLLYLNYLVYALALLTIISLFYCTICVVNKKFHYYLPFTYLMYFFLLFEWLLFLPMLLILNENIKISSSLLITISNILIIIFYIILEFMIAYFNMISSISNKDIFSVLDNSFSINYFFLKFMCFILVSINTFNSDYFIYIIYFFIFLMLLKMTYDSFIKMPNCNRDFFTFFLLGLAILYERMINCILKNIFLKFFGFTYRDYYLTTIITFFVVYVLIKFSLFPNVDEFCLSIEVNEIKTVEIFIKYINSIISLMNKNESQNKIILAGFIDRHRESCIHTNCPINNRKGLYIPLTSQISDKSIEIYKDEVVINFVIKEIFNDFSHLFHNNFDYNLHYIKFILFNIGNLEMALTEMELIREMDLDISQEFILYLLKEYCNDNIVKLSEKSETRFKQEVQWSCVNMLNFLKYDKYCNDLIRFIFICSDIKKQLWKTLQMTEIYVEDVFEIGNLYYSTKEKLMKKWEIVNEISSERPHSEILNIFCNFLLKICNDDLESEKILEKKHKFSFAVGDELFMNRFKNDTGVIVIDGNRHSKNLGVINYLNKAFLKMVNFNKKHELIGTNISSLMPSIIGNLHNELIIKYYEKGRSNLLKKTQSNLCILTKEKYLVPIHLLVSLLPSCGTNVDGIAILRRKQREDEIIITDYMGIINSMTKSISDLLNLGPEKLEKGGFYAHTIFPELLRTEIDGTPKFFNNNIFNRVSEFRYKIFIHKKSMDLRYNNTVERKSESDIMNKSNFSSSEKTSLIVSIIENSQPKSLNKSYNKKKTPNSLENKIQLYFNLSSCDFMKIKNEYLNKSYYKNHNNIDLKEKLLNIYNFNASLYTKDRKYENKEISFTHTCLNLLEGSTLVRSIIIPSEQLFEKKLDDEEASESKSNSKEEEENSDIVKGVNDIKKKKKSIANTNNLNNDSGSVTGNGLKSSNLEENLKRFKNQNTKNNLWTQRLIGLLMILTVNAVTISTIYSFVNVLNFCKSYLMVLFFCLNQNSNFIDMIRYSTIINLKSKFRMSYVDSLNIDSQILLNQTYNNILQNQSNLLNYSDIFDFNELESSQLQFYQNNFLNNFSYLNGLYILVSNTIIGSSNMISFIIDNSLTFVNFFYSNINLELHLLFQKTILYYNVLIGCILITGLILIIILLSFLFYSYKSKKDRHNKILKAYEALTVDELKKIISDIDDFEKKYHEQFRDLDDFKHKKSIVTSVNSKNMIFRKMDKKHSNNIKPETPKNKVTRTGQNGNNQIVSNVGITNEIIKKQFLNKSNMTLNYILSVIMIFTFILAFKSFIFIYISRYLNVCNSTKDITENILENKFQLNYMALKLDEKFHKKTLNQYLPKDDNMNLLLNFTINNFLDLKDEIMQNVLLFQSNITDIMSGNICSVYNNTRLCNLKPYVLQSGLKSLVSYYIEYIKESMTFFEENYSSIKDLSGLFSNQKFIEIRFLIEKIKFIYTDIFSQFNDIFVINVNNSKILLIIIGIIFNIFFCFLMIVRLREFIEKLVNEENLCNRLVTEIPIEIINLNKDFRDNLSSCFKR